MKTINEYWALHNKLKKSLINDITLFCRYMKPGETIEFDDIDFTPSWDIDATITGLEINDDNNVSVIFDRGDGCWDIDTDEISIVDLITIYDKCLSSKNK